MAQESVDKVKQTHIILSIVNSNAVAVCLGFSTNMINDFVYKKALFYFVNEFRSEGDGFIPWLSYNTYSPWEVPEEEEKPTLLTVNISTNIFLSLANIKIRSIKAEPKNIKDRLHIIKNNV